MFRVAVIGTGQLGCRHLQGILKCENAITIFIVDSSPEALKTAEQKIIDLSNNSTAIFSYVNIELLPDPLDIVIVATNSHARFQIVKTLLNKKKIRYLILEKVLFQDIASYYEIKELLNTVPCWVNHTRRMFPVYQKIKSEFLDSKQITMTVEGGNWGFGCNALHFLDLFAYVSNDSNLVIDELDLFNIFESKRPGYKEFCASLKAHIANHSINLIANNTDDPLRVTISDTKKKVILHESEGQYYYLNSLTEKKICLASKIVYFQSELTHILIDHLLNKNTCLLPSYNESMAIHIPFIQAVLQKLNCIENTNLTHCPIT